MPYPRIGDMKSEKPRRWYAIEQKEETAEISIFDEIGGWFGLTVKQFKQDFDAVKGAKHLKVLLNSPGGDVFDGMAVYNLLSGYREKISVEVLGVAASIASVIALAGKELVMGEGSYLMIHNPWGVSVGGASEMRKTADLLEKIAGQLATIYTNNSYLDRQKVQAAMNEETWYTAPEALEAGFADRVEDHGQIAAMAFDFSKYQYRKLPQGLAAQQAPLDLQPETTNAPAASGGENHTQGGESMKTLEEILAALGELGVEEMAKITDEHRELVTRIFQIAIPEPAPAPQADAQVQELTAKAVLLEERVSLLAAEKQELEQELANVRAERHVAAREALMAQALEAGKITPKNRAAWEKQFDADPEGTRGLLEAQEPVVDMRVLGTAAGGGELSGTPFTEKQRAALRALGLSEARIAEIETQK